MQSEAFLLHDIISWGVLESFSEYPITGWMREFTQAIPIEKHAGEASEMANEERKIGDQQSAIKVVSQMLDKKIESITL